jgi:hypothetical protein
MAYPNAEDYIRAVQQPARSFRTPELETAVFELHPVFGIPMPASGNAAVVFKAAIAGTDTALRFFIREDASDRDRYRALGRHFATHGLDDCVARAAWVDDAISVNGATWPVIQMSWVDGRTLDAYVGHLATQADVGALATLATSWRGFVGRLQAADFAHGDLQHGNVLVDTSSALRLVDFDGSWISAFSGGPPPHETGHPNYQRTGRAWGRWMDTFPALVIYTALLALSRRPAAWGRLQNGENILFSAEDFAPPFRTRVWQEVDGIADPEVRHAGEMLRRACAADWKAEDTLEALLTSRPRIEVTPAGPGPAPLYVGVQLPTQRPLWWERTVPPMPTPPPEPAAQTGVPAAASAGSSGMAWVVPPGGGPATLGGVPGRAMPPPPPKTGPGATQDGASGPSFAGSHGAAWFGGAAPAGSGRSGRSRPPVGTRSAGGTGPSGRPGGPAGRGPGGVTGSRPSDGKIIGLSLLVALAAALLSALVVGRASGESGVAAGVAAVFSGLAGFGVTAVLQLSKRS